jgi:hypothetical protein
MKLLKASTHESGIVIEASSARNTAAIPEI